MSESESRSEIVLELAEEFLERYRRGERPPLREYIDRHPELAAEIREVFPAMAMMENIAVADESLAGPSQESGVKSPTTPALQQLGDYRIIREIGRGGMGVVYEAEQVSLGRHVAFKVLPDKALLDAKHKQRFEREARAAAKLHHTNIVPVFGVGEHEGMPYYVMQFIQGLGLDAVLEELQHMQPGAAHAPSGLPTAGEIRIAHRDIAAAEVARSLMTGEFQPSRSDGPGLAANPRPALRADPGRAWTVNFCLIPYKINPAATGFLFSGVLCRESGMPSSPGQRQLRRLQHGRAQWKARSAAKQREIRQLRVTLRDVTASRDLWKQRCRELKCHTPAPAAPLLLAGPAPQPSHLPGS